MSLSLKAFFFSLVKMCPFSLGFTKIPENIQINTAD